MKKSQKYYAAMICVVNDHTLSAAEKLEIIEQLTHDKTVEEFMEKKEEEENL